MRGKFRSLLWGPLALLLGGCWTLGAGQPDPTRYPWDQPRAHEYCVVSLELPNATGIGTGGGQSVTTACTVQPNR